MQQEVVLALLAKEPAHAYQLRARLDNALGPLGEGLNAGHVYVTLSRLERAGLVEVDEPRAAPDRSDRKLYTLTPTGQERVSQWLSELSWPKPGLAEFHLKLIAAASAGLADPISIIGAQRRELLRRLRDAQHAAMSWLIPMLPCCWRALCSDSRLTCAGWRPASGTGPAAGAITEGVIDDEPLSCAGTGSAQGIRPGRRPCPRRNDRRSRVRPSSSPSC